MNLIRKMCSDDLIQVEALAHIIWSGGLARTIGDELPDMFSAARWRPTFFVVEAKDRSIIALAGWNYCWCHYGCYVFMWAGVRADHRRHGIGRALVQARIDDISAQDADLRLILLATSHVALYQKYGFVPIDGVIGFPAAETDQLMMLRFPYGK